MSQKAVFLTVFCLTFSSISLAGKTKKTAAANPAKAKASLVKALKGRSSRYFSKVKFAEFSMANMGGKQSVIGETISGLKNPARVIPVLIGVFRNKDEKVRMAVYPELSLGGPERLKQLFSDKKNARYIKKLKKAIDAKKEKGEAKGILDSLKMAFKFIDIMEAQKKFKSAITSSLSSSCRYLQTIPFDAFVAGNVGNKGTLIEELASSKPKTIPKIVKNLLCCVKNKDPKVRAGALGTIAMLIGPRYKAQLAKEKSAKTLIPTLRKSLGSMTDADRTVSMALTALKPALALTPTEVAAEKKKLAAAIKGKSRVYFASVGFMMLSAANVGSKATYISECISSGKSAAAGMPALISGFRNKDPKVRALLYGELANPMLANRIRGEKNASRYISDLRRGISSQMRREKGGAKTKNMTKKMELDAAKTALSALNKVWAYSVEEICKKKSYTGLAKMDPEVFGMGAGYIHTALKGKKALSNLSFFLKAVTYARGNKTTQAALASALGTGIMQEIAGDAKNKKKALGYVEKSLKIAKDKDVKSALEGLKSGLTTGFGR